MHPQPIAARAGSSTLVNSLALAGLLAATLALSACGKNEEAEARRRPQRPLRRSRTRWRSA